MTVRTIWLAATLCAATLTPACARDLLWEDPINPTLRADVTVQSEIVRIGDLVDNAGALADVAVFRAPDLGMTGSVPTSAVLASLRAHQILGVETGNIREVSVTRAARTLTPKDIEAEVARALERRNGLGNAADLTITFDRDLRVLQLDPSNKSELRVVAARYEPRGARFDVTFDIGGDAGNATRLRFAGTAVEMLEAAIPLRNFERGEVLKASDVALERRPKSDVGSDALPRERAVGMQVRRAVRAGQPLRAADLGKPDLVTRDQTVSIVYEMPGIYLTMRGKAVESGAEGDTVTITNLQSKRTVQGIVVGPGQVSIAAVAPRLASSVVAEADVGSAPKTSSPKPE